MTQRDWHQIGLGADDRWLTVDDTREVSRAVAALAAQARRRLDILTPDLERGIYDNADFLNAVRGLVTSSSRTAVRVLVGDSERAVKRGHRVIELARTLTTSIDLHRPGPTSDTGSEGFLLVDDRGVVWRADSERADASVCFDAPVSVRRLRSRFDELWEDSQPDPELRRLHI